MVRWVGTVAFAVLFHPQPEPTRLLNVYQTDATFGLSANHIPVAKRYTRYTRFYRFPVTAHA